MSTVRLEFTQDRDFYFQGEKLVVNYSVKIWQKVCQSTGVQIAKISDEPFKKIHLVTDQALTMFGVLSNQIKILQLNNRGFITADVFSVEVGDLQKIVTGASSIYMKDGAAHHWLAKWSPEKKLARLIAAGDLELAQKFADHFGLCDESIAQTELQCQVADNKDLKRISQLLKQIEDQTFLCDFAQQLQGKTDAEKLVLEHVESIEMEEFYFEMYHNEGRVLNLLMIKVRLFS